MICSVDYSYCQNQIGMSRFGRGSFILCFPSVSMSIARRPSQMLDPATAIAIAATNANVCYTPQHFSLSKKGLLQIDYSCNWNNLDRYIAK